MKKLLALFIILTFILIGCGGGTKDTNTTTEKKAEPKVEVKKELIVTMKIGDEELKFSKASFLSNAMTPSDKTTKYTLYGTLEGSKTSALNIEFDSAVKDEREVYLSLKKYKIEKSTINLEIFEAAKHKVSAAKGTFKGQLRKIEENGFLPTGDPIDFSGTFVK
ncbi:MAG: hypothetical protein KAS62_08065 [Candidatus Delongbacteria bacterium]|nr:hypothetical protein [Candidatus Delongbacteria bacterium]